MTVRTAGDGDDALLVMAGTRTARRVHADDDLFRFELMVLGDPAGVNLCLGPECTGCVGDLMLRFTEERRIAPVIDLLVTNF